MGPPNGVSTVRLGPGAQLPLFRPELRCEAIAQLFCFEDRADIQVELAVVGVWARLRPLDGLVDGIDVPEPEAGDQLFRFGKRSVDDPGAAAIEVEGVQGLDKVYARKTGFKYHVDLHIEVDPALTVAASHMIAGRVRGRVRERLGWVADVLVHIEPASQEHGSSTDTGTKPP